LRPKQNLDAATAVLTITEYATLIPQSGVSAGGLKLSYSLLHLSEVESEDCNVNSLNNKSLYIISSNIATHMAQWLLVRISDTDFRC
jgi:hypothetical protein